MSTTDTAIRIEGRPPLIYMQDPGITVYCPSSKLFARTMKEDNSTRILAYTQRVDGKFAELQEVLHIAANVDANIKVPWVCPWPYTITDWSHEHVRVDSEEDPSFWCVIELELLPIPFAYMDM